MFSFAIIHSIRITAILTRTLLFLLCADLPSTSSGSWSDGVLLHVLNHQTLKRLSITRTTRLGSRVSSNLAFSAEVSFSSEGSFTGCSSVSSSLDRSKGSVNTLLWKYANNGLLVFSTPRLSRRYRDTHVRTREPPMMASVLTSG